MQTMNLIVTDFGEYPMSADISARYDAAKKTESHRIDKRTREGKALLKVERQLLADAWRRARPVAVYEDM